MKKTFKNYEDMTIEELEDVNQKLDENKSAIREEQLKVNAVITRKTAEAEAGRKLENMSSSEREALAQLLKTEGIESGESVSKL